ncbi:transporter substrate-binding domain-containing protein [Micromonospora sp. WMMD980]|uniref:transporter substrate-binding domain-containing protein n=1 Tax=Micromonospora sp. WMMD980 TaxID=3016088 RepID=UPI00241631A8|nr:transporter substrate-binding domain-containing protein [Micromonospora sp. WMMD980]MDG4801962.1 transporter substrate-binding domain-containing protein [Micromonospora sp. WMMD980]
MNEAGEPRTPEPAASAPPRRGRARRLRLVALAVVLAVLAAAMVPIVLRLGPPTRDELMEQAGLKGKPQLLVGVKDDQPGVSQRLPNDVWKGFDVDIAYMIAGYLGFDRSQVRFLPVESEDRARRQARDGDGFVTVDLVIASYSITRQRQEDEGAVFSAAYLQTEQSVITLRGDPGPVSSLEDLADRTVCTLTTSTAIPRLRQAGARPIGRNRISDCVQEMFDGKVSAVTSDAAILAGFVTGDRPSDDGRRFPVTLRNVKPLRHWDIGESAAERWGVNTGPKEALRDLVDMALYASARDPRNSAWEEAYTANFRWQQRYNLPQSVAVQQQPDPRKVEVRQWPWERIALPAPAYPGSPAAPVGAFGPAGRPRRGRRSSGC